MKTRLLCIALMLAASALFAGSLDKYKDWPNSPQGYFMTAAERADWKANVKSDADAEEFVKKFLAKRDAGFAADVAQRADAADKHLTVSGRKGSTTLRGKLIILLGPPTSFSVADREVKGNISGTADMYSNIGSGGGGRSSALSPNVGDMAMAANSRGMSGDAFKDYTFTYAADRLPVKQAKDFTVVVEVRAGDGTDRVIDHKAAAQLDALFEQAAAARIVTK
jgi:GWxTD domain-containing protein